MRRLLWCGAAMALLATGFGLRAAEKPGATEPVLKSGIDKSHIESSVRPQDDLFRHVNGKWLAEATIPADRPMDGAFYQLRDKSESDLKAIIEENAGRSDLREGSDARKIGDLYASFMDEERVEKLGLGAIEKELAQIDSIADKRGLFKALAELQRQGARGLFSFHVDTDAKHSDRYIIYLGQGGLGLPDESYYREPKFQNIRDAYVVHLRKLLDLAQIAEAESSAKEIMTLETRLASAHWDRVKNRDETRTYNKKDREALAALTPGIDWPVWFEASGAHDVKEVVVRQPDYFSALAQAIEEVSLPQWKLWMKASLINSRSPLLSKAFVDEHFEFYGRTLTGTKENRPRWKRGVASVEASLGEALGKLYVEKHFPPAAKERMLALVKNLTEAYRQDIETLEWMGPETRKKALEKLAKFTPKIGYPDKWRDYSKLAIQRDDLVGNIARASAFEHDRGLAKLGQPVDRGEWFMTPQTVNAYYNPGMNEIVFPASILQPPFFDMEADIAVNYGAIGAVIGHEIGHGFDDQGSKYDGNGNMDNWWTDADRKEFERRTKVLIAQYDAFTPAQLTNQHVNGSLTIGENIGDLGGLTIAYKAYHLALQGRKPPELDGLTGQQRFFIGWAQVWRAKYRDAELQRRLTLDPHSPAEFRCNGVVRNLPEFYEAFAVKEGDKLWLPARERARIW